MAASLAARMLGNETFKEGVVAVTAGDALPAIESALYVVATPLGNLRDVTLRALDVLGRVDLIAAEDTRVTHTLLAHHGIAARTLSLHEHNERARAGKVIEVLAAGGSVALVTDAGTPTVSDPGAALVNAVTSAGYSVVPVPGPSAVIAALSISGLSAAEWLFCGFLPAKEGARRRTLARLSAYPFALVFYEAPHRIVATAGALAEAFGGDRTLVIARELTKRFESIHRCRLGDAIAWLAADADRMRGEFVLIVDAPSASATVSDESSAYDAVLQPLLAELPLAQAVRLAAAVTGAPRNALYQRALALRGDPRERD
jgi:16S rRNA (cytidine1402-2'-O)-methyltransferase